MSSNVLFTAVKNEAPFLIEWIAYHLEIGFDKIVIYSNTSDDGTNELLDVLAKNDVIIHRQIDPEPGASPQAYAAKCFNEDRNVSHGDYLLWLDADEFLNITVGARDMTSLRNAMGKRHGAVFCWRIFGDSNGSDFDGRFITEKFSRCSERNYHFNRHVKTLIVVDENFDGLSFAIHWPKLRASNSLTFDDFVNPRGDPLLNNERNSAWLEGRMDRVHWGVTKGEIGHALAQINHYLVRTRPLFRLKKLRGRGAFAGKQAEANNRHTDEFFDNKNKNEEVDTSILFWDDRVTKRMQVLLELDGVAGVQREVTRSLEARLAALATEFPERKEEIMPAETPITSKEDEWRPEMTFPVAVAEVVKDHYRRAECILEFGMGGSTAFAAALKGKRIFSVENSSDWYQMMLGYFSTHLATSDLELIHVDIGPTKKWGRPKNDSGWRNYHHYSTDVWRRPDFRHPDVVLIDGRCRTACFLSCVVNATKPVTVLFDDYSDRPHYHVVEKFAPPKAMIGRMAIFHLIPRTIDGAEFSIILDEMTKTE